MLNLKYSILHPMYPLYLSFSHFHHLRKASFFFIIFGLYKTSVTGSLNKTKNLSNKHFLHNQFVQTRGKTLHLHKVDSIKTQSNEQKSV